MMILKGRQSTNNKWESIRIFDDMEMNEIIQGLYMLQSDIEENGKEINSSIVYLILTNYREDVL